MHKIKMFQYKFQDLLEWYGKNMDRSDLFDKTNKITMYNIEKLSKQQIRKRKLQPLSDDHQGYLGAFCKQNLTHVAHVKFIKDQSKYLHGLFCVCNRRGVYAVYPTLKEGRLFADHISFMEGNVHFTKYIPQPLCIDFGVALQYQYTKIKDGSSMPLTGYDFPPFAVLSPYHHDALDLARANHVHGMNGGGLSRSGASRRQVVTRNRDISPRLEQILLRDKYKSIRIFCVKSDRTWHVTCFARGNESFGFVADAKTWPVIELGIIDKLDPSD